MRRVLLSLVLVSCAPSVDPSAQKDVDGQLAQLSQQNRQFGAPSGFEPMPFAVGQWTRHKVTDDNNRPGIMTYKVIGQEADAWWVEIVTQQYTGRMIMKMLVNFGDRKDPSTAEIRDVWQMDKKGRVTHIDGAMLAMMKGVMKSSL